MPSLPKLSSAGMAFLLSLLPLLLLGSGSAQGASLREHRLRGSELDPQRGETPYLPPNADMLKALEYIESLRQRTGASAPQEQASLTPDYDTTNMDTDSEKLLSMLRLTHEWLQVLLNTLQQTKKGPKPAPVRPSAARHALGKGRRPAKVEDSQVGEGVAYSWSQQQRASRPHRKYPLMFEDEEDVQGRESPFKRTNENMEGKYTPQNLANLQSVFEELGRMANAKAGHKRQTEDDEEDEDDGDDDDMFKVRNLAYEDVTGGEDWTPLEEQVETEDEERDNRELEEEEEREERRAAQTQYSDKVDPQAIYQLIQISQKLQIPPEDLMDMTQDKLTQISSHQKNKIPPETFFNRRLPETQTSNIPEEIDTEDILKILGLGSVANQNAPALKKQKQHTSPPSRFYAPAGRQKAYMFSEPNVPEKGKDDYDNSVDEDELSAYLAAQMLAQYPQTANKEDKKKRASQPPSQDHQLVLGTFEQAIQDYFDQMDSDKSPPQKRQSEPEEDTGDVSQMQGLDDDTLLKILGYLNPETEEDEDKDLYSKTVKGL
uniref:Secretogranin II n=1 Tax=Hucho hucho TaxID=62062 RepID=A0A4W5P9D6_9TELE